jgi:hypothetical protein
MHLRDTTETTVADFLRRTYTHQKGPPWACAVNGEVVIYLDCYPIELMQFDDCAWLSLIDAMKALPAVTVIAHVMRRHTNHPQAVPDVLTTVLGEFRGVAQDQSGCCWSLQRPVPSQEEGRSSTPESPQAARAAESEGQAEPAGWGYVEVGNEKPAAESKGERGAEPPKHAW